MKTNTRTHTPEPWIYSTYKIHNLAAHYIEAHPDHNNGHAVAECFGPDGERNARLIAAAPEMFEALAALDKLGHLERDAREEIMASVRAVIAPLVQAEC